MEKKKKISKKVLFNNPKYHRVASAKDIYSSSKRIQSPNKSKKILILKRNKNSKLLSSKNIQNNTTTNLHHNQHKRPQTSTGDIKNINFFYGLFNSPRLGGAPEQLPWVANLRSYNGCHKNIGKAKDSHEPSFYQADLEKFIQNKKLKKSKSDYLEYKYPDLLQYKHFLNKHSDLHGTVLNKYILNFEVTLRNNHFTIDYNKVASLKHQPKWNNCTTIFRKYFNELPVGSNKNKINEKLIMRPYSHMLKKIDFDGRKIIQNNYFKNKNEVFKILGDHLSFSPYNDKYPEKNAAQMENLLYGKNKSQCNILFELGLNGRNIKEKHKKNGSPKK